MAVSSQVAALLRNLKRATVIASVFSMMVVSLPSAYAAPVDLLSDSFGTGATDSTFGESPDTSVGSNTWSEDNAGAEKRAAASGNDTASTDGDRFAVVFGDDGELCIQVDAAGYNDVQVSYEWRGDGDVSRSTQRDTTTCRFPMNGEETAMRNPTMTASWKYALSKAASPAVPIQTVPAGRSLQATT